MFRESRVRLFSGVVEGRRRRIHRVVGWLWIPLDYHACIQLLYSREINDMVSGFIEVIQLLDMFSNYMVHELNPLDQLSNS